MKVLFQFHPLQGVSPQLQAHLNKRIPELRKKAEEPNGLTEKEAKELKRLEETVEHLQTSPFG